ncbi:MAG: hypothetical protein K5745_03880 [Saccharofermentans sp.]|nr:hypothetical protein [Saccharofermentans sp.]
MNDAPVLEYHSGEMDAVNNAMNNGVEIADIEVFAINRRTGQPKPMCNNCFYTFVGSVGSAPYEQVSVGVVH